MKTFQSLTKILAACVLALPALALNAQTTTVWKPAGNPTQPSSGLWSDAGNWTGGAVPDTTSKVVFNVAGSVPCIVDSAAAPAYFVMGDGGVSPGDYSMIIANGGSLTTTPGFSAIGYSRNASLEVQAGGSMTVYQLWVGLLTPSIGTFILSGGTVTCNDMFGLGWDSGTGLAHINAGTLNLHAWHDTQSIKGTSIMDLAGGTVVINGNHGTSITNFINAGRITAYGGAGTVICTYDAGANTTTLTAVNPGGGTPPPQRIISVTANGDGTVTLQYETTSGFNYHVETSSGLTPASWSTVPGSTVSGTGSPVMLTVSPSGPTGFFRTVSP